MLLSLALEEGGGDGEAPSALFTDGLGGIDGVPVSESSELDMHPWCLPAVSVTITLAHLQKNMGSP